MLNRSSQQLFKYLSARAFQCGGFLKRMAYEKKLLPLYQAPIPVISIGNITIGGTGKTPFVLHMAQKLTSQGFKVSILSRGYKGLASKRGGIVSDGNRFFLSAKESGDEPYLLAKNLKNVPVFVGKHRWKTSQWASDFFKPDVLLLDDAHQHFKLSVTARILLIDCLDPFGGKKIFPQGRLRESLTGIQRAQSVILTHASEVNDSEKQNIIHQLKSFGYKDTIHELDFLPSKAIRGDEKESFEVSALKNKKIFAFTAIASPQKFLNTLNGLKTHVVGYKFFRDHHYFTKRDMENIYHLAHIQKVDMILTTEKDSVRIEKNREFYHYLKMNVKFKSHEEAFFSQIKKFL